MLTGLRAEGRAEVRIDWRAFVAEALDVYVDEIQALDLLADRARSRADDLRRRADRLRHVLALTDPTKEAR